MDFFQSQDDARRKTKYLVFLFLMAITGIVILVNLLVLLAISPAIRSGDQSLQAALLNIDWTTVAWISISVVAVIAMASIYKISRLSGGGKTVALHLGGRPLMPNTNDPQERQVLNVVEEMALAAGMPVPSVYLLADEEGINAFAAGYSTGDAVVGITKGCMNALNREQLQGVIGHEFSHILNGDMRLNIRLVGILHGILFLGLVGRVLLYGSPRKYSSLSSRRRDNAANLWLGLGLVVIGYIGYFFGGLIKAAVSRQREFLADAASVQFTRNPQSIADALKVIAVYHSGAKVKNPNAEETSHFFFESAVTNLIGMFATHPPIETRISKIQPHWDGQYLHVKPKEKRPDPKPKTDASDNRTQQFVTVMATQIAVNEAIGQLNTEQVDVERGHDLWEAVPEHAKEIARDPWGARALIYCLLLDKNPAIRKKQIHLIQEHSETSLYDWLQQVLDLTDKLNQHIRLAVIDMCIPALKTLSEAQYKNFIQLIKKLVEADQKIETQEWCLYTLIRHYLSSSFEPIKDRKPIYKELKQVSALLQILFTLIADHGHTDPEEAKKAYTKGMNSLGLYTTMMLEEKKPNLNQLSEATQRLARCYPLLKPRILKAIAICIEHDGTITPVEMELLHTIAAILDSPIPPLKYK